jgi:hypothetical protein
VALALFDVHLDDRFPGARCAAFPQPAEARFQWSGASRTNSTNGTSPTAGTMCIRICAQEAVKQFLAQGDSRDEDDC